MVTLIAILKISALSFIQNIAFTITSRSRNRDNKQYHIFASIFSNGIWLFTMKELILSDMSYVLFIPYILFTVLGSVYGMSVSMKIEKWLGATSDSHVNTKK